MIQVLIHKDTRHDLISEKLVLSMKVYIE